MDITEAKQAVIVAKQHLQEIYQDEQLLNLGLEEVEYVIRDRWWNVTLGFSRPWNQANNPISSALSNPRRTYKVVSVLKDGTIKAIKNRD